MAANLEAIHRALAAQIRTRIGVAGRDIDTNPFDINPPTFPAITVLTDSPYIDYWDTFGPNGKAVMKLRLRLDVEGDPESMAIQICAYLSIGTDKRGHQVSFFFERGFGNDARGEPTGSNASGLATTSG